MFFQIVLRNLQAGYVYTLLLSLVPNSHIQYSMRSRTLFTHNPTPMILENRTWVDRGQKIIALFRASQTHQSFRFIHAGSRRRPRTKALLENLMSYYWDLWALSGGSILLHRHQTVFRSCPLNWRISGQRFKTYIWLNAACVRKLHRPVESWEAPDNLTSDGIKRQLFEAFAPLWHKQRGEFKINPALSIQLHIQLFARC